MIRRTQRSTLFPYTTLFRSWNKKKWEFAGLTEGFRGYDAVMTAVEAIKIAGKAEPEAIRQALWKTKLHGGSPRARRSEEHTSELQSRGHLVCRLLLEKKKPT